MAYSKIRQHRGRKNCGGHKKKRRGAGNRGGRGKAGRSKHKFSWVAVNEPDYFSKPSMKPKAGKPPVMNLSQINNILITKGIKELDVSDYKILGRGTITKPVKIKALSFSKSALEKIKAVGGKAEPLYAEKTQEEPEVKVEDQKSEKTTA
jgi:large subunit ribosomal protein L15